MFIHPEMGMVPVLCEPLPGALTPAIFVSDVTFSIKSDVLVRGPPGVQSILYKGELPFLFLLLLKCTAHPPSQCGLLTSQYRYYCMHPSAFLNQPFRPLDPQRYHLP